MSQIIGHSALVIVASEHQLATKRRTDAHSNGFKPFVLPNISGPDRRFRQFQ